MTEFIGVLSRGGELIDMDSFNQSKQEIEYN